MNEININWLIKNLPDLIRKNDEVKGAIITALSGVVATREDIKDLIHEMDKRFEKMDKRFEKMDIRFEKMDIRFEKMDKRFDTMDKRFEKMDKRFEKMDKRFEDLQKDFNSKFTLVFKRLDEISIGADISFELFCKDMIKHLLEAENKQVPYIESGRHFQDANHSVFKDTTDIEIDLFCPNPPIVGEITYKMTEISKMDKFLKKIEFLENKIFESTPRKFLCALEISSDIYHKVLVKGRENQIEIISKEVKT